MSGHSSSASNDSVEKLFASGITALGDADKKSKNDKDEKTTKILGLIEVPQTIGTVFDAVWNEGADEFTKWLQPRSFKMFQNAGGHVGLELGSRNNIRTAAVTTIALNTALKSGAFIHPVFHAFHETHVAKQTLARKMAPILDLNGNHSVSSLMHSQNDMIRFHCQKLAAHGRLGIKNSLTKLIVNVAPSMLLDIGSYKQMWNHDPHAHVATPVATDPTSEHTEKKTESGSARAQQMISRFARMGASPLANIITRSNERAFERKFSSGDSALEMVLELQEQVAEKPDAESFKMPGKNGRSMKLKEYVREVIKRHAENMADISPDHTEIREALKDDLDAAAETLAKSIKSGDISALSLVQLIGSDAVIKRQGRAIADPEEIQERIDAIAGKVSLHASADPKEYFKEANFTIEQLKQELQGLKGEEKMHFASMLPNEVLRKAGMDEDEVKTMRHQTVEYYSRSICAVFLAMNEKSDEDLKKGGLAGHEIKVVRQISKDIQDKGEEAVAKMKNNPGANHAVPNWIVSHASEFGTLLRDGEKLFEEGKIEKPIAKSEGAHADKHEGKKEHREHVTHEREHAHAHGREA